MNLIVLFAIFLPIVTSCISPIEYMEPPPCIDSKIKPIGIEYTYKYANLLFGTSKYVLSNIQRECILNSPTSVSNDIKKCIQQITINNNTIPKRVAQGLAMSTDDEWVSACAPNMPCAQFNEFVLNNSFSELINDCKATEIYKWLIQKTSFIESSWYGIKYCQHLYPNKCLYLEQEPCNKITRIYPCPISRWVYASNFMLLYVLSPNIASKMPGCRII